MDADKPPQHTAHTTREMMDAARSAVFSRDDAGTDADEMLRHTAYVTECLYGEEKRSSPLLELIVAGPVALPPGVTLSATSMSALTGAFSATDRVSLTIERRGQYFLFLMPTPGSGEWIDIAALRSKARWPPPPAPARCVDSAGQVVAAIGDICAALPPRAEI